MSTERVTPVTNGKTILVVDDEAPCLQVVGEMLELLGYKIMRASSGTEAIKVCKSCDSIDLALVDMIMPGLSGIGTMTKINVFKPDMKFLILTGMNLERYEGMEDAFRRIGCLGFIQKPCPINVLSDKIRWALLSAWLDHQIIPRPCGTSDDPGCPYCSGGMGQLAQPDSAR